MTQHERMKKGLIYDPMVKELLNEQVLYQDKLWDFNQLKPSDYEKKQEYMIFSNQFVSKVMFYLWEEVCKDAPEDEQINFMRLKEKITRIS